MLRNLLKPFKLQPSGEQLHYASIRLNNIEPVAQVNRRYLSYSIDISVLAGGFWWEGSAGVRRGLGTIRVPPVDLQSKKLGRLVSALGPAYLRVGGSEADKIHYFNCSTPHKHALILTEEIWDGLQHFLQRNPLKLAFTFKYGLFQRTQHGEWDGREITQLLKYSHQQGYRIDSCELGNELNAYWAFHGIRSQPRAAKLAKDYATFSELVKQFYPESKIIGPGSAFWPKLGETLRPFSNITPRFLKASQELGTKIDIIDWHYYPFQSDRSPVKTRAATLKKLLHPKSLNEYGKYAQQLKAYRDQHYPDAQLWTGETGSAQCGGQEKLSDRFASCFWWADQLGMGALNGQQLMIRQSLIGGDYGMIDRLSLNPRPDYWLSWLWKSLMGTDVYKIEHQHHLLRCYCHNTPDQPGRTLLLVNLSGKPVSIEYHGLGKITQQFVVTANKLNSKKLYINGKRPKYNQGRFTLEDFTNDTADQIDVSLPPHSINFWLLK